jgi:hypothetical protein
LETFNAAAMLGVKDVSFGSGRTKGSIRSGDTMEKINDNPTATKELSADIKSCP